MESDPFSEMEQIRSLIDGLPVFGQIRLEARVFVSAHEGAEHERPDTIRVGVRAIAGIEVGRIALDGYDQVAGGAVGLRRRKTAPQKRACQDRNRKIVRI